MRLELFGAIALSTLAVVACNSDEESTLGQGTTVETGGTTGAGGALTGTGNTSTTGNGGSSTGNGGSSTGNGGNATGNGGSSTGNGGNATGNGGAGTAGAGGVGTVVCPTTAPTDGDTCTGRGNCTFGSTSCFCAGTRGGGNRTWRCFNTPDGGFGGFPGRDGGFTVPEGGFPQPTACTGAGDCTGGQVCCSFQGGPGGGGMFCASTNICSQFGTPVP